MSGGTRDRWLSVVFAVALHLLIAAAFVYGWMVWKRPSPPAEALAIDATVVDSRTLSRVTSSAVAPESPASAPVAVEPLPAPAPAPAPPPPLAPEPTPTPAPAPVPAPVSVPAPPTPSPAPAPSAKPVPSRADLERVRRAETERKAREAEAEAEAQRVRAAAEKAKTEAAEKARAEAAAKAEAARTEAEQARARAEAERLAREAQERAASEADLRRHLAEEEHMAAAQASGLQARWEAAITARIQRAWIRPPSARPGLDCTVHVTQIPGGEVVSAKVGACNGDEAVRLSIEAAVIRASPLPLPPDPALFVRDLEVRFIPPQ